MSRFRWFAGAVATLVAGTWLWIALWGVLGGVLGAVWPGADAWVLTSESMSPALDAGDLLLTSPPKTGVIYEAPTVITFPDGDRYVTHRIVGAEDGGYITKGDANGDPDPYPVAFEDVEGIGRLVIPWVGLPLHWWGVGQWYLSLAALGSLAIAWWVVRRALPDDEDDGTGDGQIEPSRRRHLVTTGVLGVVFALVVASTAAAFTADSTEGAALSAAADFGRGPYSAMVLADNPAAYWRLGEIPASGGGTFATDFESGCSDWTDNTPGGSATCAPAPGGGTAIHKTTNNDWAGGWADVGFSAEDFTLEVWVHRPSSYVGGSYDRIGVEDSSFNGYTFGFRHDRDQIFIERRTNGSSSARSGYVNIGVAYEDRWYRAVLTKSGSSLDLDVYDDAGGVLGSVSWTDSAHSSGFSRVVVHGGHDYYLDDISLVGTASGLGPAIDSSGNGNHGFYVNPVSGGAGSLVAGSDTSVDFGGGVVHVPDSSTINLGSRDARTLSMWLEAADAGRQLAYEEGGGVNGLNVYLDGLTLYATAYNSDWSKHLITNEQISAGTHHVGVVLDATGDYLALVVDGTEVDRDTKTDGRDWHAHSDDTGIGRVNGETVFHDGRSSTPYPFGGRLDEVAIYNAALPVAQLTEHWANGSG